MHNLKVGDRVTVYGWANGDGCYYGGDKGTIREMEGDLAIILMDHCLDDKDFTDCRDWWGSVHIKQCRKLKPVKKTRTWWINYCGPFDEALAYTSKAEADILAPPGRVGECLEVREVRRGKV